MSELPHLASAMLAVSYAAFVLVAGQLFIEYRSARDVVAPVVQRTVSNPV